ncbi:pyruvate, phosphate dikinase [Haliangium sp.]|uniref:pyruvate, phosphate dikinase n=1 Tax=Haliangium sp. TaxID=2663208 RepID=UPI003D0DCCFC
MTRYVYRFRAGEADGRAEQSKLLGGKGAGLAEMAHLGLPVPPGFTITTEVCNHFYAHENTYPAELPDKVDAALDELGELTESGFGMPDQPLLLAVRAGAPMAMPGMMDTVLDLGLNDETVQGLAARTGDLRFAYDCYRRFVAMYGRIVMGVGAEVPREDSPFARILADKMAEREIEDEAELSADDLKSLVTAYKIEILREVETPFPEAPLTQLWGAVGAVLRSWNNPRARVYRRLNGISDGLGTAVTVQAMVFGNLGPSGAAGVAFTRDPSTGERHLYGEFLLGAQGDEVVSGHKTPVSLSDLARRLPEAYAELVDVSGRLEEHFGDLQNLEFTVEHGKLWLLETRAGECSGRAAVRIAVDLVREGRIDEKDAVLRVEPDKIGELLRPGIDPAHRPVALASGLPAAPGAAVGRVVFSAADAAEWSHRGDSVILVRVDTSPEDIHGMKAASGILTARGGMTSHAAVVARAMGKSCVTSCAEVTIDMARERFSVGETVVKKGDVVTLDGATGELFPGALPLIPAASSEALDTLMGWVDDRRRLKVRTNADTPVDARTARAYGAEGIGLCRTEHMFFGPGRLIALQRMILAADDDERRAALDEILPLQRADFREIFEIMDGLPVTIRLLDPPLHEFLPRAAAGMADLARELDRRPDDIAATVRALDELNPMLGQRGCRLGLSHPAIYDMQARAIAEAAVAATAAGITVKPEIMVPFVSLPGELRILRERIERILSEVLSAAEVELAIVIGTTIEVPRACLVGDQIAAHADFFSFGTNDLTQTTYGISRDDAGRFLPAYLEGELMSSDPFTVLDRRGVGALIRIGVEQGRAKKTKLKIGICGEHGGEPRSIEFCHREGFDYVSCSPFRVPVARIAAAQAALRREARAK